MASVTTALGKRCEATQNYRHKNPTIHCKIRRAESRFRTMRSEQREDHANILKAMGIFVRLTAEPGSERMHSLHEPGVVCITKGKPHKPLRVRIHGYDAQKASRSRIILGDHGADEAHHQPGPQAGPLLSRIPRQDHGGHHEDHHPGDIEGHVWQHSEATAPVVRQCQVVKATIGRKKSLHGSWRNIDVATKPVTMSHTT